MLLLSNTKISTRFLVAKLRLDSLAAQRNVAGLKATLDGFQTIAQQKDRGNVLTEMYNEAMQRVMAQKGISTLAIDVLTWIYYSDQELSTRDLQVGVALQDNITEVTSEIFTEVDELVSSCYGLVAVDETSETIRLAHFTAQDYFDTNR